MPRDGLFRQRQVVNGKRQSVGSYRIDMLTPFSSVPRLVKSSGVFPTTPNARDRVREIKLMVKDLIVDRDESTLVKLQRGQVKLLDALHYWKQGRISQVESHLHEPLIPQLRAYIDRGVLAATTQKRCHATVNALIAKQLLNDNHLVRDVVEILQDARDRYDGAHQPEGYNNLRIFLLGFIRKHLRHPRTSLLYQQVSGLEALAVRGRQAHHPLLTPHDLVALLQQIATRDTLSSDDRDRYAQLVVMMCFHGMRPTEFLSARWERDKSTGHLRIRGTKTPLSNRVVPMMTYFRAYHATPIRLGTINSVFERIGIETRLRDFRRTYSIWCELAGIPRARLQRYLGHAPRDVTDIYQQVTPQRAVLNEDRDRLRAWFEAGLKQKRKHLANPFAESTSDMLSRLLGVGTE